MDVHWHAAKHEGDAPKPCCIPENPLGGREEGSYDPSQPQIRIPRKVIKGGSRSLRREGERTHMNLGAKRSLMVAILVFAPLVASAQGAGANSASASLVQILKSEELEALVAPIALYPDALLAQVLMASTYPVEVVQAERRTKENKTLKDDQLRLDASARPAMLQRRDEMHKILILAAGFAIVGTSAWAQTELSGYADANGFIDVQKLTCARLAGTYQQDADMLTSCYSGSYNGLAKKHFIHVTRGKADEHEVIVYCKANPEKLIIEAIAV